MREHTDGRQVILALLGSGDVFGELALLDGEARSADAVVQAAGELLVLDRSLFHAFLNKHPELAARLLATLSRRLRRTDDLVQDAAFLDVRARLARLILFYRRRERARRGGRMQRYSRNQTSLPSSGRAARA